MSTERTEVAIVGAGLSGLCVGATLRRAGQRDFVILDRAEEVGGTWRENTYPGCACDIPSALYSFSFAPNPGWTRFFAGQAEIQRYTRRVADDEGLRPHIRFGRGLRSAHWDEDERRWRLVTEDGGEVSARFLVACAGPWHEALIPPLPGLEGFGGRVFHSSRWDHDHDLAGRRVAVIGTGASAVQFVPEIQPAVEHLTVFQRTPHWVLPKPDRGVTGLERTFLRNVPGAQKLVRAGLGQMFDRLNSAMHHPQAMAQLQRLGELNLRRGVRDPVLRAQLTPQFALGCKRILMSNDWYPALGRENVTVVPAAVESIGPDSVTDALGTEHPVDTIIFATGFHILDMPVAELVHGRDGRTLAERWQGSPRAYLGTTVSGYPNAFLLLGPNVGINTSATILMELQAAYIRDALRAAAVAGAEVLDVDPAVQARFNAAVDEALKGTVWNAGGCRSYFLDATGRNGFNYPWTVRDLRRRMLGFDLSDYVTESVREPLAVG